MNKYPSYRYDDNFVLKVSLSIKAIVLYSLRHLVIIGVAYSPSERISGSMGYLKHQIDPLLIIPDLLALVLVYAWFKRGVSVSDRAKAIWHKGRELLMISVGLHFALMLWLNWDDLVTDPADLGFSVMLQGLLDIVMLLYLFRSTLVKDVFADYPGGVEK